MTAMKASLPPSPSTFSVTMIAIALVLGFLHVSSTVEAGFFSSSSSTPLAANVNLKDVGRKATTRTTISSRSPPPTPAAGVSPVSSTSSSTLTSEVSQLKSLHDKHDYRPYLVREALANNKSIYYFGLGSNMSRKKLENRGINGTKIEVLSMEAAYVPNHRLSFNMRGFPPLEPGMGSIEPVDTSSTRSLLTYHSPECHGALVLLTAENYEKVMRSEGVGATSDSDTAEVEEDNITTSTILSRIKRHLQQRKRHRQRLRRLQEGYEEVVVDAYPYSDPTRPVKAIALRARKHVRLPFDPCPSERYMTILKEGAKELGLKPCYQSFLEQHPVQKVPKWLKKESLYNLITTFTISSALNWRGFSRLQSRLLFAVYNRHGSSGAGWRQTTSDILTGLILLPGAATGYFLYHALRLTGRTPSPFISRFMALLDPDFAPSTPAGGGADMTPTTTTTNPGSDESDNTSNCATSTTATTATTAAATSPTTLAES